jgi:TonB family protein
MQKTILATCFGAGLLVGLPAAAQVPRDTPPPAIENARRARELRAQVAAGTATKETYIELARLARAQGRYRDEIEALRGAATVPPVTADAWHSVATVCWQAGNASSIESGDRLAFILEGIAAEDRALTLKPDYVEAMTYKQILLRSQATLIPDREEQQRLIAQADALRTRVAELQRQAHPEASAASQGFSEPFEQSLSRVQPVRVGGGITQPVKIHDVRPVYPADAQAAHVQGVVIMEALIGEDGSIVNARVLRSIPLLDEAALAAVSRWQFAPTQLNGRPVGVIMTVTVNFTLQ